MSNFVFDACNPSNNVVVEACAGSGKTWLLTARLFRLLLAGAPPEQILAITFTRKAAEEMKQRLFALLKQCALGSDAQVIQILQERGAPSDPEHMEKARALAGKVLTNSRGVTIDTFHGWFTSLCQMAPLGSGFSRQNEPTEQTDYWMDIAIDRLVAQLGLPSDHQPTESEYSTLKHALDVLSRLYDRAGVRHLFHKALSNRVAFDLWLQAGGSEQLSETFGLDESVDWPHGVLGQGELLDWQNIFRVIAIDLGKGSKTQVELATQIETTLTAYGQGELAEQEVFEKLRAVCLTKDNTPRKGFWSASKALLKAVGGTEDSFRERAMPICEQFIAALQNAQDQKDLIATRALAALVPHLYASYSRVKAEQGLCDFDDLEFTALHVLMDENQRHYMLQKMDARIKHLLLDEFQDTNPVQWAILKHWLGEYGEQDRPSVFMVGDPKQSIYRFRRAEARLFAFAGKWLKEHFNAIKLESDTTRRCQPEVVNVVNRVFAQDQRQGETPFREHLSLAVQPTKGAKPDWAGLTLYPVAEKDEQPTEAAHWVAQWQSWMRSGRIEKWSDIMVLVRTHQSAIPLVNALREAGLPFVLKDKGERYQSMVWQDTIAILRFLISPDDNFALLQLLRSPLFMMGNAHMKQLIEHGHGKEETVWTTLQNLAQTGAAFWLNAQTVLKQWLSKAHSLPLFETLTEVARSTGASLKYLQTAPARYRTLMAEHWDWLKAWALNVNRGRFPDLQLALAEAMQLAEYGGSDGEGALGEQNAIAILTVHSAKGLEADHVVLFDACQSPAGGRGLSLNVLIDWPLGEDCPASLTVRESASSSSPGRQDAMQSEIQALTDEEDHLLYVALTRARCSVHVSGTRKRSSGGWYSRLQTHGEVLEAWPYVQEETGASKVQTQMAIDLEPKAHWRRVAYPEVPLLGREIGEVVPRLHGSQLRMGTAWHNLLEYADEFFTHANSDFEFWWASRALDCEKLLIDLDETETQEVKAACRIVLTSENLSRWFNPTVAAFNELEWVEVDGHSLRADRVVKTKGGWVVLDYKWAVNSSNLAEYTEQVLTYVSLVNQTLAKEEGTAPTQAALIDRTGQIHWLTSV